ncbi:hypothetical protein ACIQWR_12110 [Streptomyces sp. NPDC098789]|uniref:hypothetical protein n=1 Tax=Streptomyces sp. NPDC098789 TaxID=3366098 RepID=UPI0038077E0C
MTREARLAAAIDYVLAHPEEQPADAVPADWVTYLLDEGGLTKHGVLCFHFQAEGRRTPAAEEGLAAWAAARDLDPAAPWPKAVALARALRLLLAEEEAHQARRRARQEQAR